MVMIKNKKIKLLPFTKDISMTRARGIGSLWTTFFFTVMWLPPFRVFFSVILGCPRLCLDVLLIYMTIGGPLTSQGVLRCGK
jgi:hypothetical protein